MGGAAVVERFLAAFSAADLAAMRMALAPDLVAWVTDAEGAMERVEGGEEYQQRIEAMDLPAARRARRPHPSQLRRPPAPLDGGRIAVCGMVDAKPAESDAFWAA